MLGSNRQSPFQEWIAATLCGLIIAQPALAEPPARAKISSQKNAVLALQGQQRVLHALNRLTFGPRPGDVSAVQAIGLDRWFEQQLHPQSIPDDALDQRLAKFPAMQLSQAELMQQFPGPQMIKQIQQRGGVFMPTDPMDRALYRDQIALYKQKQENKAAGKPASKSPNADMQGDSAMSDPADTSMQSAAPAKKKGAPRINMLGPDSTNSGNLKKPGKRDDTTMAADDGQANRRAAAPATRHKEQFYPELTTQQILSLPPQARVERVLAIDPETLADFRKSLSDVELAQLVQGLTPQQREVLEALQGSPRMVGGEILQSRLERDIYSERQLEAVMTDFWLNHFNVYIRKNQNEPYLIPTYERETIRPRALGKFEDLLVATAQSPAMLVYLDNWQSIGPNSQAVSRGKQVRRFAPNSQLAAKIPQGLNENYGRELMELHTLGAMCAVDMNHPVEKLNPVCGTGYTQKDVTEVAKVFTGWGIDRPAQGGQYSFLPQRHEPGSKTVLGHVIKQAGESEGLEVLHQLATSPATAHFISSKLVVRFVSDNPPPALVERMAQAFLNSGGDIKTVLQAMYRSPEFWSTDTENSKMKTPLEFVVSAVRASGAQVTNEQALVQALDHLGMPLYGMQTPNGYSWSAEPWSGTGDLVNRMNFALALSGNRLAGVRVDWGSAAGLKQVSDGADGIDAETVGKEQRLELALLGREASSKTRATVLAQFGNPELEKETERDFPARVGSINTGGTVMDTAGIAFLVQDRQAAVMAGLLLGSPEFQRR